MLFINIRKFFWRIVVKRKKHPMNVYVYLLKICRIKKEQITEVFTYIWFVQHILISAPEVEHEEKNGESEEANFSSDVENRESKHLK